VSVPTNNVSASIHATEDLASGSVKPSATNCRVFRSNSRTTLASAPPRDSDSRQRPSYGRRHCAPFQTQFSFSFLPSASRSRIVSQAGCSLRYSASVVRRHKPR